MSQSEIIFAVRVSPECGSQAKILSHSIYTEAETRDELKKNAQDAVRCHFEEKENPSSSACIWSGTRVFLLEAAAPRELITTGAHPNRSTGKTGERRKK